MDSGLAVEGLRPNTIARWRTAWRQFDRFLVESRSERKFLGGDLDEQTGVLRAWIGWLRGRGVTHVTVAAYWNALLPLVERVAREQGAVNPLRFVDRPKYVPALPRYLSRDAVERLMRYVQHASARSPLERARDLAVVGCMVLAGLRRGEVLGLSCSDVRLDERTLLIRRGKGRFGGRDRLAYMPPQLAAMLTDYLAERGHARRTHAELFTSLAGNQPFGLTALRRLFRRLSAGIGFAVRPHALRHSYASMLRAEGVDPRLSMDLLGHRSLRSMLHYAHVFDGEHASASARLRLSLD